MHIPIQDNGSDRKNTSSQSSDISADEQPAPTTPQASQVQSSLQTNGGGVSNVPPAPLRSRTSNKDSVDLNILKYLKSRKTSAEEPDEISEFFNSMPTTVRKFPEMQKVAVKFKIHQVVHEAEMGILFGQEHSQHQIEMPGEHANSQFLLTYQAAQNILHER